MCDGCVQRLASWVTEIVELWASVGDFLELGSVPDDTAEHKRARKQPASPALLRLDAWALVHPERLNQRVTDETSPTGTRHTVMEGVPDVPVIMDNWAQAVFTAKGWGDYSGISVGSAAAVIGPHVELLCGLPDVDTFDAELRWVRKSLRSAHGISNQKPLADCIEIIDGKECSGRVWEDRDDPAARPRCDKCGRRYGPADQARLKMSEDRKHRLARPTVEPAPRGIVHSGRSGIDQAVDLGSASSPVLRGTLFTDQEAG